MGKQTPTRKINRPRKRRPQPPAVDAPAAEKPKTSAELNEIIRAIKTEPLSGSEIAEFRLQLGMTPKEFSNLLDVSIDTIKRLEAKEAITTVVVILGLMWLMGKAPELEQSELEEFREAMRMSGEELKKERLALGLSQEKLARLLGVSFATVNRWETGKVDISTMPIIGMAVEHLKNSMPSQHRGKAA